jgi:hypothetical protein
MARSPNRKGYLEENRGGFLLLADRKTRDKQSRFRTVTATLDAVFSSVPEPPSGITVASPSGLPNGTHPLDVDT